MRLYLIRHGQTDWNVEGKIQGSYDCELNENGIDQAKDLSAKIKELNLNITKIYTSQQKRALKTAIILSESINKEYIPISGLEEMNLGEWEGHTWVEVEEKYPETYHEWKVNRRYTRPHKGETYQELLERVLEALHNIITNNNDDVAIVTHSAVIMCLQCFITGTHFNKMTDFKIENSSITEIDSDVLMGMYLKNKIT